MRDLSNGRGVQKSMKAYKANVNASRQMVQQMKMQEAQALAEIPLEETLVSETSSEKDDREDDDSDAADSGADYDEEEDKSTSSPPPSSSKAPDSDDAPEAKSPDISLNVYGRTDVGQIREHNEDNFLIADLTSGDRLDALKATKSVKLDKGGVLLTVCDGMGGAAAGEVASQLAADIVYERMAASAGHCDRDNLGVDIIEALEEAGQRILEESNNNRACRGMGTTATVAAKFAEGDRYRIPVPVAINTAEA